VFSVKKRVFKASSTWASIRSFLILGLLQLYFLLFEKLGNRSFELEAEVISNVEGVLHTLQNVIASYKTNNYLTL